MYGNCYTRHRSFIVDLSRVCFIIIKGLLWQPFFIFKNFVYIRYIYMKYELKVPTSLSDITLGQYQEYIKLPENLKEIQVALKMISIFCNVPEAHAKLIKASDVNLIIDKISKMFTESPSLIKKFKIGKVEYGFIPNLDNITFGEYIDVDTYLSDWDNIERAMAVLYRPIKSKYDNLYNIEEYEAKEAPEYKQMPLSVVMSSILFFYNLGSELCQVMMDYSLKDKQTYQQFQTLVKSGDGINQFSHSLKGILQDLKISLN